VGDCDGNREVSIAERVTIIDIALGEAALGRCSSGDRDHDGKITIDEVLAAVHDALDGCSPTGGTISIEDAESVTEAKVAPASVSAGSQWAVVQDLVAG
jgi:hypothetical protein